MPEQREISCDACQQRLVALLDGEIGAADEATTSAHLETCPECRAFQQDMLRIRQEFVSAGVPSVPETVGQEVCRAVEADALESRPSPARTGMRRQPVRSWRRRLAWAGGVAALVLLALSWLVSLNLANQVAELKDQLQTAERDLAVLREQRQVEESQRQLAEAQRRQEKAVAALQFRTQELEEEVHRFRRTETVFLPESAYEVPDKQRGL